VNRTDETVQRVAVILSAAGSERGLLALLEPLFASGGQFEVQGVFLEDAEASHAANLPFIKEVCRVTYTVREFTSDQFEHNLALRVRTARRAFAVVADRSGLAHSFRNVRGPGIQLLRDAAATADITVFEPAHLRISGLIRAVPGRHPQRRIAALVSDAASAPPVLRAALQLAAGDSRDITVMLAPGDGAETTELLGLVHDALPRKPAAMRFLKGDEIDAMCLAARELGATMAVLSAHRALEPREAFQLLRARMPCPVCLVRGEPG
jgi:hypothetical protein